MSYNKNSEEYNFLYYSQLFVQINNLHNKINESKQDDKLIFHINMCNNICITQLHKNKYMKELIKQINTDDHENENESEQNEDKDEEHKDEDEEHEDENESEQNEDEEQDHEDELKVQINNITNLLGGEQELDINDFDPNSLNNFGNGLKSLLTPIQSPIQAPVQPSVQAPVQPSVQAPVQPPIQTPVQRIQRTKTIQRIQRIVPIQSKTNINVREQNEVPQPIIKNEIKEKYQNTNLIVKIKKKNE